QRLDDPGLNGAALHCEAAPRRGCARGGCGPGPGYRAACGRALRAATRIPDSLRAVEPEAVEAAVPRGYRPAPPCPPAGPPTRLSAYRSVPLCGPGPGGGRGTVPPGLRRISGSGYRYGPGTPSGRPVPGPPALSPRIRGGAERRTGLPVEAPSRPSSLIVPGAGHTPQKSRPQGSSPAQRDAGRSLLRKAVFAAALLLCCTRAPMQAEMSVERLSICSTLAPALVEASAKSFIELSRSSLRVSPSLSRPGRSAA